MTVNWGDIIGGVIVLGAIALVIWGADKGGKG